MRCVARLPLFVFLLALAAAGVARPASAQAQVVWTDAPLADALYEFADRTGIELVFALRLVRDIRVSGRYQLTDDPDRALALLLRGSGLRAERIRESQYVIIQEPLNVVIVGEDGPEAYTGTMEGRVVDAATGEPLWGAHVWLVDLGLGDVAATDGTYAVPNLPTGRYAVRFSYVGYQPVRLELDVFPDSPRLPPTIRLQQVPIASSQAVVEGGPDDPGLSPGVVDLAARQAAALPVGFSDGDLAATLSWLPGLSRTGGASGALVVRGADPNQTRTLRDGVPLYEPWHAFGLLSAFQPEALGRVRLHRGALPATHGGALAAVLDVESTDALAGDSTRLVDLGPLMARTVVDVGLGAHAGLHLSARRSTLGLFLAPRLRTSGGAVVLDPVGGRFTDDGPRPSVGFDDAEAKLSLRLRSRARLDLAGSFGRDGVRFLLPGSTALDPLDYRWRSHTVSGRYRALHGSRTLVEVLGYRTGHDADEERPIETEVRALGQALVEHGATVSVEHYKSAAHELQGGLSAVVRRVTAREAEVEVSRSRGVEIAAFVMDTWSPARSLKIQPGARIELVSGDGRVSNVAISPRLFARWTPKPDELVFRVGLSRQTQAVHRLRGRAAEGYDLAASRWLLAGRRAPLASAWQAGAGTEWAPSERIALSVDGYGRWSTGLLEPANAASSEPGVDVNDLLRRFPAHDGRAYGVEVAARSMGFPWTVGLTAAVSRTEVRQNTEGAAWRSARYDRPLLLGLIAERRVGRVSVSTRIDVESGLVRASGERAPMEARAGVAVGMGFDLWGMQWGARAQATARPGGAEPAPLSLDTGLPLATDARGFSSIPLLSLSARW